MWVSSLARFGFGFVGFVYVKNKTDVRGKTAANSNERYFGIAQQAVSNPMITQTQFSAPLAGKRQPTLIWPGISNGGCAHSKPAAEGCQEFVFTVKQRQMPSQASLNRWFFLFLRQLAVSSSTA
jgi:hypothetical protein